MTLKCNFSQTHGYKQHNPQTPEEILQAGKNQDQMSKQALTWVGVISKAVKVQRNVTYYKQVGVFLLDGSQRQSQLSDVLRLQHECFLWEQLKVRYIKDV